MSEKEKKNIEPVEEHIEIKIEQNTKEEIPYVSYNENAAAFKEQQEINKKLNEQKKEVPSKIFVDKDFKDNTSMDKKTSYQVNDSTFVVEHEHVEVTPKEKTSGDILSEVISNSSEEKGFKGVSIPKNDKSNNQEIVQDNNSVEEESLPEAKQEVKFEKVEAEVPVEEPKKKKGFNGLFAIFSRKKKNSKEDELDSTKETEPSSKTENSETKEDSNVTVESEVDKDSDPATKSEINEESDKPSEKELSQSNEQVVSIDLEDSSENKVSEQNSTDNIVETNLADGKKEESSEESVEEPKKPSKFESFIKRVKHKGFYIGTGIIGVLIIILLFALFYKDRDGNNLIDKFFTDSNEPTETVKPVENNNEPVIDLPTNEDVSLEGENPEMAVTEIQDEHTEAIHNALVQPFEELKGSINKVTKTSSAIKIEAEIKKGNILEINRLVRIAQIESYPYMIDGIQKVEVFLNYGKNYYSFETSITIVEFIAKLNYEDRHSAQMWWSKTKAYKNGINLKSNLIKDRLYVETLNPIYPEIAKNEDDDQESVKESDKEGDAENSTDVGDSVYDKDGLKFTYPKQFDLKEKTVTEDGETVVLIETSQKLPTGLSVRISESSIDEGKAKNPLQDAFNLVTTQLEKDNPTYKGTTEGVKGTSFKGIPYITKKYTVTTDLQTYYLAHSVILHKGKLYEFSTTSSKSSDINLELILKSIEISEPVIEEPSKGDKENKPKEDKPAANANSSEIRGDKSTKTYYLPNSEGYDKIDVKNLIVFSTEKEATSSGYKKK